MFTGMHGIRVDQTSGVPPYDQLRRQLTALAEAGELVPGTRLPPVRQAAADLGLAANTVARAYRELEAAGVVVTRGRKGTFVASPAVDGTSDRSRAAHHAAEDFVDMVRRLGLTRIEASRLVDEVWD
jgi:DNA-binding transcriptional regulator YhcF (GntR family)